MVDDSGFATRLQHPSASGSEEAFNSSDNQDCIADEATRAVLSDWSAQDFANIYVRFVPHLKRHASRYLDNPSQVEEVVQDAFLYLMTSLPELDSELGVLKFLKWKVKMLSIDVIRLTNSKNFVDLDNYLDEREIEGNVSDSVERAEDAAVVSLALSKLNPRHREIIVKSVYEEKSARDMSVELGLSENATRQLLLRAKRSFRVALIGQANVNGMTISEILSLAARNSKQAALKVSAFIAIIGMGVGAYNQIELTSGYSEYAQTVSPSEHDASVKAPPLAAPAPNVGSEIGHETQVENQTTVEALTAGPIFHESSDEVVPRQEVDGEPKSSVEPEGEATLDDSDAASLRDLQSLSAAWMGSATSSQSESDVESESVAGEIKVHSSSGFSAFIGFDPAAASPVSYLYLRLSADEYVLTAVPQRILVTQEEILGGGNRIFVGAADMVVGDLDGALGNLSYDATRQLRLGIQISLELDEAGQVADNVSMEILQLGKS